MSFIFFNKQLFNQSSSLKKDFKTKLFLRNSKNFRLTNSNSLRTLVKSNNIQNHSIYSPTYEFQIPNFLNVQRSSFREFLKTGLINEFENYHRIKNSNESIELIFYPKQYKLNPPKWNPKQAILKRKTYACQLYLPVQLINHNTNEMILQWVLLGNLPLMTKNGHFIINGSPKIIMNQIVRSPGVYFQKILKKDQKLIYSADFIAQRGAWLRLEVDSKKGEIWAKLKKTPKIPIFIFLRCLGLNLSVLNNYFQFSQPNINSFSNNKINLTQSSQNLKSLQMKPRREKIEYAQTFINSEQNFLTFCEKLYPKKNNLELKPKLGQKFLYRKFLNPRTYNLSKLGRLRINQKLGLQVSLDHTILTAQDILFACIYLIELVEGVGIPDDIDDLKNRKIKSSGELIQTQLATGLIRLEKSVREKLKQMSNFEISEKIPQTHLVSNQSLKRQSPLDKLLTIKPINSSLREFFGTNPLSQLLDQTNPLAELTHKRRLSSLGPGGINRETAGMAIRGIHPTHYGRICPIETPEGQNAGLVNSITIYSNINKKGFIETPFYQTYKGYILKTKDPLLFSSDQEEKLVIAPGDIKTSLFHFLPPGVTLPSRQLKEFKRVNRNQINYIALSPIQMISVATSLIPFLEHDDGNRALMGSNMQRQAVPTIRPSKPIVGTGLESRVVSDSEHGLQAKVSGFVSYVDGKKIVIHSSNFSKVKQTLTTFNVSNRNQLKNYLIKTKQKKQNLKNQPIRSHLFIKKGLDFSFPKEMNQTPAGQSNKNQSTYFNFPIKNSNRSKIFVSLKAYQNTKKLYSVYNQLFTNHFSGQYEIFNIFASKTLKTQFELRFKQSHALTTSKNKNSFNKKLNLTSTNLVKPLFSNQTLTLLKKSSNKMALLNYSSFVLKFIINPSILTNKTIKPSQPQPQQNFLKMNEKNMFLTSSKTNFIGPYKRMLNNKGKSVSLTAFINDQLIFKKNQLKPVNFQYLNLNYFTLFNQTQEKTYSKEKDSQPTVFSFLNHQSLEKKQTQEQDFEFKTEKLTTFLPTKKFLPCGILNHSFFNYKNNSKNIANSNQIKQLLNGKKQNKIFSTTYFLDPFHRSNQDTYLVHRPIVNQGQWVEKGDLLADNSASVQGELAIGQNILVGYTPWEGYNFEDAVLISQRLVYEDLFTSLHIERYEIEIRDTQYGMEEITNQLPNQTSIPNYLDETGIAKKGTWVHEGDILVGKIAPLGQKTLSPYENLLYDIIGKQSPKTRDTSLRVPRGVHGRVVHIEILQTNEITYSNENKLAKQQVETSKNLRFVNDQSNRLNLNTLKQLKQPETFNAQNENQQPHQISKNILKTLNNLNYSNLKTQAQSKSKPTKVHIYLAEKRKIQVGDKIAGRHGNKGIVSNILPQQDMPYLPDGTPLDLVLNPLGVPSRMNVGQIFECLLGLAGYYLGQNYKIQPFDELYGCEASRSLVYSKLYEARLKTGQEWLFNPNYPGKTRLFDGRTGECFEQPVTVGRAYILKLVHLVDEKIHARSTGPYSLVTQQPLRGRSKHGGQRVGEMEVWALEGFGAAYVLQELLTIKSDDIQGRHQVMNSILNNDTMSFGTPESFKVLVRELQSLCLDISIYQIGKNGKPTQIDIIKLP
uniref:DNA-directed RNA polymerase subunit beta n=1 Tax=Sykidion marinum TaxID=44573 RepID=A0A1W6EGK2_SYKMA|nr:beta subunit of RNA polymerase [Pseudoneochloris marina]ARK14515.1 beta subunit of RNA polymerase [Pseudoneochloris marina]